MHKFLVLFFGLLLFVSCEDEVSSPRPFGYFRIDLPEAHYQALDIDCPYTFNYSDQSTIVIKDKDKCWINIYYPKNKATIYLTYVDLNDNLKEQLDQTQQLTYEHQIKATKIDRVLVQNDSLDVYGLTYKLEGDVASYIQFYLTDSSDHFLRGALYFDTYVNTDSLRPVISYMDKDVEELIRSFKWK